MDYPLGQYLRTLRGKMSLREAGARSEMSFAYIRDLEVGINRSNNSPLHPSRKTLKKLSEVYNCSYHELLIQARYPVSDETTSEFKLDLDTTDAPPDLITLLKMESKVKVGTYLLSTADKMKLMDIMEVLFLKHNQNNTDVISNN